MVPNGQLQKPIKIFKAKEYGGWKGRNCFHIGVAGNVFFRDINIDVDPSLKQMPWQSKLKSGTWIAKGKVSCQGSHYIAFDEFAGLFFTCNAMYHICVDNLSHHFCVDNGHIPKHSKAGKHSRLFRNGLWVHYTWVGTIDLLKKKNPFT